MRGVLWRSWSITTSANARGFHVTGVDMQSEECNKHHSEAVVDKPCVWGVSAGWSDRSYKCDGAGQRFREILGYRGSNGQGCLGSSTWLRPCHISEHTTGCENVEPPTNCKLSD